MARAAHFQLLWLQAYEWLGYQESSHVRLKAFIQAAIEGD